MAKKMQPHLPQKAKVPIVRIGEPPRRQYIAEWIDSRDPPVTDADVSRATGIDKSTISRWRSNPGQIPQPDNMTKLAGFLRAPEPDSLLRHPEEDWLTRAFRAASEEQKRRFLQHALNDLTPKAG